MTNSGREKLYTAKKFIACTFYQDLFGKEITENDTG